MLNRERIKVISLLSALVIFLAVYGTNCGSSGSGSGSGVTSSGGSSNNPGGSGSNASSAISIVGTGQNHACAVVGRRIQCWGSNIQGQLGNGTLDDSLTGVWVSGISGTITALTSGESHNCALVDGAVYCWGASLAMFPNNGGTTPTPIAIPGWGSGVTALAAGQFATCAIIDGGVQCMGDSRLNALGRISTAAAPDWVDVLPAGSNVSRIDGARSTFCVSTRDNAVFCWGSNLFGNLARGFTSASEASIRPMDPLGGLPQTSIAGLTASNAGTCVQNFVGTYCVGDTSSGYLGTLSSGTYITTMALSNGLAGYGQLMGGYYHHCRLDGGVLSCVGPRHYMFADGVTSPGAGITTLAPLTSLGTDVTSAAFSKYNSFACAVKANEQIVCWGSANYAGQLGHGDLLPSAVPVTVQLAP